MKKASKLLALCLALLICAACTACQSRTEKAVQETPTTEAISVEEESPVTEETTAIEATTAAFKPVVVREAPEYVLPDLSEIPNDIKRDDGTDGEIIVPYLLSTDEMLNFPEMKGPGEFDGYYSGSMKLVRDNIVSIDIYEYVVYHKEDIQGLQFGDKILFENELLTVNGTMFEHEETKTGNVTVMLEGCQSPFGRSALYVTPQYAAQMVPNEDYCVDYNINDLAYKTYVKTIEVALGEEIDIQINHDGDYERYPLSDFLEMMKTDSEMYASIYNEVIIYDDYVWIIYLNSSMTEAMKPNKNAEEINAIDNDIVIDAVNPAYSIETLQGLRGQSTNSAALDYRGCLKSVEGKKATIDIYKTDFYKVGDLKGIQPSDSIVIYNELVTAKREYNSTDDSGSYEVVLDNNDFQYVFKKYYDAIPDYCLTHINEPMVSYYKTIEVDIAKNVLCAHATADKTIEMSLEEMWQFLQDNPEKNNPGRTDIMLLNGKLFGYAVADNFDPFQVN